MSRFAHHDIGFGYWIIAERVGSGTEYHACKLDRPGGFIVDGKSKHLPRMGDAKKQVQAWIDAESNR